MNRPTRPLDWVNILFLSLTPLAAIVCGFMFISRNGITASEITLFVAMFFATGLSITAGYHRLFSHASYQAHPWIRNFYLIFGACAMQNSALHWAADHRLHHRYTDTEQDPYNAGRGFWWSHIGWIFYQSDKNRDFSLVADLQRDRWVQWQHKHHVAIALTVGFGGPLLLGLWVGNPLGFLLWGGLIRVVFVHHATFFINSLAHLWGQQPYSRNDSSVDSWWLAYLTNGEGYHNFHHRFPSDYRNGIQWYQWDPTKWLIFGLSRIGITSRLHRIPKHLILKSRLEIEALDAEKRITAMPHPAVAAWRERMETARHRLDLALTQWAESRNRYWEVKKAQWHDSELLAQAKTKMREYEVRMDEARSQWRELKRGLQGVPLTSL